MNKINLELLGESLQTVLNQQGFAKTVFLNSPESASGTSDVEKYIFRLQKNEVGLVPRGFKPETINVTLKSKKELNNYFDQIQGADWITCEGLFILDDEDLYIQERGKVESTGTYWIVYTSNLDDGIEVVLEGFIVI